MAQTTYVNMRGIAHKQSNGQSLVFPDVCLTPVGNAIVPFPYPNLGRSADTCQGPLTVKTDGAMPMVKDAKYQKSSGDEAGSSGGIISGTTRGECEFLNYSFDVKFEGRNVCRLGDQLWHNNKNIVG